MRRLPHLCGLLLCLISAATSDLNADDRILVEAKLNGQPLKLAFDTGAGGLIIFRKVAEQRHLKVSAPPDNARPAPGEVLVSRTEPVSIEFFGLRVPDAQLMVFDSVPSLPLDVDGVLGWPAIRDNIWSLNGSSLQVSSLPSVPRETTSWIKLRELKERKSLCFELPPAKTGEHAYLGIDTGKDSGVSLSPEAWVQWRAEHSKQPVTLDAYFMPGAGLVIAEEVWATEINLAGLILRDVPVRRMNPAETAMQPPGTIAILGLTAVRRTNTVLDGKTGFGYMHPLDIPSRPYGHNRLGAVFVPADLKTSDDLLAHVAPESPAAEAGIRDGDILLKIDALDVTRWRTQSGILPLKRFFVQPSGTKLQLTVRRGSQTVVCNAVLKDILGPAKQ